MIGWLHLKLVEKANENNPILTETNTAKPNVGAAIKGLGGNSNTSDQ